MKFLRNIFFLVLALTSLNMFGQDGYAGTTFSVSGSHNYLFYFQKLRYKKYDNNVLFTIGKQANADLGISKALSFGVGMNHQTQKLQIYNYKYNVNGINYIENPMQIFDVYAVYVRILLHNFDLYEFTKGRIDLYAGAQGYYTYTVSSNTSRDPAFHKFSNSFSYPGAVAGVRFYFIGGLGIQFETALPAPYTISLGLSYNIHSSRSFKEDMKKIFRNMLYGNK